MAAALTFCVGFLVATKAKLTESWFLIRPQLFEKANCAAGDGARFGPFAVTEGAHYLIQIDGSTSGSFELGFTYSNGGKSRTLLLDRRGLVSSREFRADLRADRADATAALVFHAAQPIDTVNLARLQIYALQEQYYTWRAIIAGARAVAAFTLLWATVRGARYGFKTAAAFLRRPSAASSAPVGMRRWGTILAILAVGFGGTFFEHRFGQLYQHPYYPAVCGLDDSYYFFWLRSVMVDGDVDFSNDLLYCDSMPLAMREDIVQNSVRTRLGLLPNKYPIGWALTEVPWYCAADLTAQAANLFGARLPYDGWHPFYQTWIVLGQLVYACAGLSLALRIVSFYLPPAVALCGVTLTWLASSVFYYQMDQVSMAHNVMFFAAAGAYYTALRLRENPDRLLLWALIGLFCALVILARYQGGVLLLFPGVVCLQAVLGDWRRMRGALLATAVGAVVLSIQLIAWRAVFGSYFVYSYAGESFFWSDPQLYNELFSSLHGLFNWHPAMLIGFAGFALWGWRCRWRTDALCYGASLLLVYYVNASWYCWWFGGSFGLRAFEACTIYAMIGVTYLLTQALQKRFVFSALCALLLLLGLWNMNLAWMVERGRLPAEAALTWRQRYDIIEHYWRGA